MLSAFRVTKERQVLTLQMGNCCERGRHVCYLGQCPLSQAKSPHYSDNRSVSFKWKERKGEPVVVRPLARVSVTIQGLVNYTITHLLCLTKPRKGNRSKLRNVVVFHHEIMYNVQSMSHVGYNTQSSENLNVGCYEFTELTTMDTYHAWSCNQDDCSE